MNKHEYLVPSRGQWDKDAAKEDNSVTNETSARN